MGILLILIIVAALGLFAVGGVVLSGRRKRRAPPVEPPFAPRLPAPPRPAPPRPASPVTAPPMAQAPPTPKAPPTAKSPVAPPAATPTVKVSADLQAEIEDALAPVSAEAAPVLEAEPVRRPRFRDRLTKSRTQLSGLLGSVLARSKIDEDTWEDLETALIKADVGVGITTKLIESLRTRVKDEAITRPEALLEALKADLKARMAGADRVMHFESGRPNVWLFVGVNGVGKTTTIGKIGAREAAGGRRVIMAAGDTFRAAAAEQLGMWAERSGADLVRGAEGGDPGSVIFDAVERAAARGVDLVLADTAGRLQTKTNLMEELRKIRRIADKPPGKVSEVLLVLDATTGQNGLVQAAQFRDVAELTGVVLTKLDGTAKGGIAFAIETELGIPVKFVGLGEGKDDLIEFDPDEYIEALFAVGD